MELDFESARERYRPKDVKFLLIAEAPPQASTGRFLYFEDVGRCDGLFLETMKVLYPAAFTGARELRQRKAEFLKRFMNDGFYLIDASTEPMTSTELHRKMAQLREHLPGLIDRVSRLASKDTKIILVSVSVYHVCLVPLVAKGFRVINIEAVALPLFGHQREFRQRLGRLLRQHGWRQPDSLTQSDKEGPNMDRPKVVTLAIASVDGRVAMSPGKLLLYGDERWSQVAGYESEVDKRLREIHHPQAILEGSGWTR